MNYVIPANIETPYGELQKTKLWMIQGSPTTLVEGLPWYDSTAHLPKYYDGTSVKEFGRVYSAGNGISISNGEISVASTVMLKTDFSINSSSTSYLRYDNSTTELSISASNSASACNNGTNILVTGGSVNSYVMNKLLDYIPRTAMGANNGVAELDSSGKVPTSQLPSFVDDVIDAYVRSGATALSSTWLSATDGGSALTPETGKIYVVLSSGSYLNKTYRWSGSTYVEISASPGAASESAAGIIEIATNLEVTTGTDDTRAVTPKKLADNYQTKLVSGTSIKTINNTSLLGSGNVAVQETLVSGTNIKTVGGESLLGSGNIALLTKTTINNPSLTASAGIATWTINYTVQTSNDYCYLTVYNISTGEVIFPAWKRSGSSQIKIEFLTSSNIAADTYKAVIIG